MQQLLKTLYEGYGRRAFSFYGRSSRYEFAVMFLSSIVLGVISLIFTSVPVIGALIPAAALIVLSVIQINVLIRRLHDTDRRGYAAFLPYAALLILMLTRLPVHALYPASADIIMAILTFLCAAAILHTVRLCLQKGTTGKNRFGTDPTDSTVSYMDFVNPEHMEKPEYLGDPWRKFKAKHEKQSAKTDEKGAASATTGATERESRK